MLEQEPSPHPMADNSVNNLFINATNSGSLSSLYVADSVYGGAFSGRPADATRQGWSKRRTPTVFQKRRKLLRLAIQQFGRRATRNKWRLLRVFVQLTDNASLAAPGQF